MEKIFETKSGKELYAETWNGIIISFHSNDSTAIIAALESDSKSVDPMDQFLASQLLGAIKVLGISSFGN